MARIIVGDCVSRMNMLERESIDCILNDPPYEIGFMGKGWDNSGVAYNPRTWKACHRVLKPGGYMLNFGATRTHHRMIDAIERAGFEVVDVIAWCYGTGFPKSHNISKAIDKAAGAVREVIGKRDGTYADIRRDKETGQDGLHGGIATERPRVVVPITIPATDAAAQWEGWGTALKPAWEPIIVARKKDTFGKSVNQKSYSQFHYIPKASKAERNRGLDELPDNMEKAAYSNRVCEVCDKHELQTNIERRCVCDEPKWNEGRLSPMKNVHPTVKSVGLMNALVKEFTEKGDTVLDAFMGSGTTGISCAIHGREFIGIELTLEYIPLAKARIEHAEEKPEEWK